MKDHYGRLLGTIGADSTPAKRQHIDVFVVPGTPKNWRGAPVVVDMVNPKTGLFDEHKVVFGAPSVEAARAVIARNYDDGEARIGAATAMPFDDFKRWAYDGTKKALPFDPSVPTADAGTEVGGAPAGPEAGAAGGVGGAQAAAGAPSAAPTPQSPRPAPAAPAVRGAAGRLAQRRESYDKNPFMTFLATHGLKHVKGQPGSLKAEFSPDAQVRVPGYHIAMFRADGKPLDLLVQPAIEDGYLPKGSDERDLYDLIARAMRGERIIPAYAEGAIEQEAERRQRERIEAEAAVAGLDNEELQAFVDADDSVPDLAGPVTSNMSVEQAMRLLGFTDEEIANALNAEQQAAAVAAAQGQSAQGSQGPEQAAPERAPRGAAQGSSAPQERVEPNSTAAAPPQGAGSQQASAAPPAGAKAPTVTQPEKPEAPPAGGKQAASTSNQPAADRGPVVELRKRVAALRQLRACVAGS
jgi:hypothetical protein